MALLSFRNLTVSFGDAPVLQEASLTLEKGEKLCLIGRNGEGKSTLLRLLHGEFQPDAGECETTPGLKVAKLDQEVPASRPGTIFDLVLEGLGAPAARLKRYHEALIRLEHNPEDEEAAHALDSAQHEVDTHNDWALDHRVERVISRLGLSGDAPFDSLSGGMKRRALLARALAAEPDLLLLDEPTNHLDIPSIEWLEQFLISLNTTLLFITHDRSLMRKLATAIIDLDRGRLTRWNCGYDTYLERKEAWLAAESSQQAVFDKKLAEEEAWIRQGIQARRTRNEGRVRALKRMREERALRRNVRGNAQLALQETQLSGRKVITLDDITYGWDGRPLIRNFSTVIWRGDKIGIAGANGSGKTTLLQLILGQIQPSSGQVLHGTKLEVAYFDQHRAGLDENLTVAENVCPGSDTLTLGGQTRHVLSYLRDFLFTPETARAPIRRLSGGERARLLLARLFARPANVIVMDEPTNDLDIETIELLEERLLEFDGTLLLVSHDRAFLNNVVTSTLVLDGEGQVREYVGGCDAWLEERRAAKEAAGQQARTKPAHKETATPVAVKRLSKNEQAELAALPAQIEALETAYAGLVDALARPESYKSGDGSHASLKHDIADLEQRIARAYERWEKLETAAAYAP